jgi:hypothetical protein
VVAALRSLAALLRSLPSRRSLFAFLASSMLYRDALNGLYGFGGVYAAGVLGWSITQMGIFGIVAALTATLASWLGGRWDVRFGPKPVILASLVVLLIVCVLLVGISRSHVFGMALPEGSALPDILLYIVGALIGAGGRVPPDSLNSFGYFLGLAFQIQDDLLNLVGELHKYGKEIGGDVLEGKRTLALIHLQRSLPESRRRDLTHFLAKPREARDQAEMALILAEMQRLGSIDHARQVARFLAGAALAEFARIFGERPTCPHRRFLRDLIIFMIERDL